MSYHNGLWRGTVLWTMACLRGLRLLLSQNIAVCRLVLHTVDTVCAGVTAEEWSCWVWGVRQVVWAGSATFPGLLTYQFLSPGSQHPFPLDIKGAFTLPFWSALYRVGLGIGLRSNGDQIVSSFQAILGSLAHSASKNFPNCFVVPPGYSCSWLSSCYMPDSRTVALCPQTLNPHILTMHFIGEETKSWRS